MTEDIPTLHLESPSLILTFLSPSNPIHTHFLPILFNDPEFLASNGGKPGLSTPEQAAAFITNRCIPQYRTDGYGRCIMFLKPSPSSTIEESTPIGLIGLVKGDDEHSYTVPDLGVAVLSEHAGKGYAGDGARLLLDYAAERLGIREVFAFTNEDNVRCQRVLEKLGMENRGIKKLRAFGPEETGLVFTTRGMNEDLAVYNLKE